MGSLMGWTLAFYFLLASVCYATPLGKEIEGEVPAVLSVKDVETYKKMFAMQRSLKRKSVVKLLKTLEDKKTLMGHLVAERLLHPKTKPPYQDFKKWLRRYHSHPQAWQVYKVANKKRPKGETHRRPSVGSALSIAQYGNSDAALMPGQGRVKPSKKRSRKLNELRRYRKGGAYKKAMQELAKKSTQRLLGTETHMRVSLRLAQQMLNEGVFDQAIALADRIYTQSTVSHPQALWVKGLALYQQENYAKAGGTFREMIDILTSTRSRYFARSAYWAGRSYEKLGRRSMAQVFYGMAAQQPLSFYGMLAHEELAQAPILNWKKPSIKPDHKEEIFKNTGIRRAIALAQIGEHEMAQHEFKAAYSSIPYGYDESLLALSLALRLPAVSLTLARNLQERGQLYLVGLYPEPVWAPLEGFQVDQALLFAISRQESAFMPNARSYAGARGLMQLMPGTAKHIRDVRRRKRFSRAALYKPEVSLQLGQDYIMTLDEEFSGNLIKMLAAYNAGPQNVSRWDERGITAHDPVLFIERIPFAETRKYVKAVMANLWLYRQFFYNQAPTMALVADDTWPERAKAYAQLKGKGTPTQ